jgi:hypothetical protein
MLEFSRLVARQFRTLARKSVLHAGRPTTSTVQVVGGADGLRLCCQHAGLALTLHMPGPCEPVRLALPLTALEACEGTVDTPVTIVPLADGGAELRWQHGHVPRHQQYGPLSTEAAQPLPSLPVSWQDSSPALLAALAEATKSAAPTALRYALDHLLLDGDQGTIAATDGSHLLVQHGYTFPWKGQVLLPRLSVYGCRELSEASPVRLTNTGTHIILQAGPWTLHLPVLKEGRYPPIANVIPVADRLRTVWHLATEDAAFLADTLPQLPGHQEDHASVTVDLGDSVCVRAKDGDQPHGTEVVLLRSTWTGQPVRFVLDRKLLGRALALGLTEFHLEAANKPLLAKDARRQLVIMPLAPEIALPPQLDALRIQSVATKAPTQRLPTVSTTPLPTTLVRRKSAMSIRNHPAHNGEAATPSRLPTATKATGYAAVLAEAQALQSSLREALGRTNALLAACKQHRRQAKAVQASLLALRELQTVEA